MKPFPPPWVGCTLAPGCAALVYHGVVRCCRKLGIVSACTLLCVVIGSDELPWVMKVFVGRSVCRAIVSDQRGFALSHSLAHPQSYVDRFDTPVNQLNRYFKMHLRGVRLGRRR